jgi:hypothetical protein
MILLIQGWTMILEKHISHFTSHFLQKNTGTKIYTDTFIKPDTDKNIKDLNFTQKQRL